MIYLASPYSAPLVGPAKLDLENKRFREALKWAMTLTAQGLPVFSPIAYYHPIATALKMPTDAEFWASINASFIRKSEAMFVLHLSGWDQSKGVQHELKIAKMINLPVVHYGTDFQPLPGQHEMVQQDA